MNISAWFTLGISLLLAGPNTAQADPAPRLDAPASAPAGSRLPVKWVGPGKDLDLIGVHPAGSADTTFQKGTGTYASHGNPAAVVLPEEPGEYELRYVSSAGRKVLARRKVTVTKVTATVDAPKATTGGALILVRWTGPNNEFDEVRIVPAGTPERQIPGRSSCYTSRGNPLKVSAPEKPGEYEIRYLTASRSTLARVPLTVTGASATLSAPASVVAGSGFKVTWKGPAGEFDSINLAPKGTPDRQSTVSDYTNKGSPLTLKAPLSTGAYELRYVTGDSGSVLARAALDVTPATVQPGLVRATRAAKAGASGAVEVVLDLSGSMLEKMGQERRIDVAKRTLGKLTSEIVPKGTPFALRVFGRGADTCGSALDLPLGPLDPTAAAAKVAALQAKAKAKTGIGAALEQVASDLAVAEGERVVILVTDGEETCGGNPARSIQKLIKSGMSVRVNIVGFAVSDEKLATAFELWSKVGGGSYFDARDEKGLRDAFSLAVRPAFEVSDAQKQVVVEGLVGGDAVKVMPGTYSIRLKGAKSTPRAVTVRAGETTGVVF